MSDFSSFVLFLSYLRCIRESITLTNYTSLFSIQPHPHLDLLARRGSCHHLQPRRSTQLPHPRFLRLLRTAERAGRVRVVDLVRVVDFLIP